MSVDKPHDALFHAAMSNVERAADLLRLVLPEAILDKLDLGSLRVESGTFQDEALAGQQSDLLLSASCAGAPVLIYLLLEHKSYTDRWSPLQLLGYLVRIWKAQRESNRGAPLFPIVPILVSHAEGGWTGPVQFSDLFGDALGAHPELSPFVPDYQFVLEDLQRRDDASLQRAALHPGVVMTLVALRDGRRGDILATLRRYMTELKTLASLRDALDLFRQLVTYLMVVPSDLPQHEFHAIMAEAISGSEDIMPTLAEQFRDEGRAQGRDEGRAQGRDEGRAQGRDEGRAQGRAEGELSALVKQLAHKFGPLPSAVQDRLSKASTDQIERWAQRILTPTTLEEVFDGDGTGRLT